MLYSTTRHNTSPPNLQTMMASTPNELIASFLLNYLSRVTGELMFEDLKIVHRYFNKNAMSVKSYE
jgi:hypothetical protein